jgi:hypothetical protein
MKMRHHIQRLELEYLLRRSAVVSPRMSRIGGALVRRLGLGARHIPYWMGQTWVAARVSMDRVRALVTSALLSLQWVLDGCELLILSGA